jgi:hypothetical protein
MTAQALNTRKTVASEPKALDRVLDYNAKVRLMVIEVLREESGRELQSAARFNGEDFDWETHNASFALTMRKLPSRSYSLTQANCTA